MKPILSWEAGSSSATQEFPNILQNSKAHHRIHKSPSLDPILIQTNQVHTALSYFTTINLLFVTE
jgi:hypothetical protein